MKHAHFYISSFPPNCSWPNGGYALYVINSDEIAKCVDFDATGNIVRRDSLPGYAGTYSTIESLTRAIKERA